MDTLFGHNGIPPVVVWVWFILGVLVYFIPSVVGIKRGMYATTGLFLANFFLGWTFIGWVGCLVWAASATSKADRDEKERAAQQQAALLAQITNSHNTVNTPSDIGPYNDMKNLR